MAPLPSPPACASDRTELPQALPALGSLVMGRQLVACGLLLLLSARLPARLAALALALARPAGGDARAVGTALAMAGLDAFGVLCSVYLSHGRLRGVPMLRCYPPRRLIPLSLHFLGLLWGLLTLSLPGAGSGG